MRAPDRPNVWRSPSAARSKHTNALSTGRSSSAKRACPQRRSTVGPAETTAVIGSPVHGTSPYRSVSRGRGCCGYGGSLALSISFPSTSTVMFRTACRLGSTIVIHVRIIDLDHGWGWAPRMARMLMHSRFRESPDRPRAAARRWHGGGDFVRRAVAMGGRPKSDGTSYVCA